MDPYTEKLVERTRQRREMLNQKLGKTPDPAPRKRVLEDTANLPPKPPMLEDDSPKRQCLWESDGKGMKPDTPAISGVKSRLQSLSSQRMHWEDTAKADEEMRPAKLTYDETDSTVTTSQSSRKSRFAQLAQNINSFEDDLSHPTIQKVEEKKPRWQPPKPEKENESLQKTVNDAKDRHVSSPRKEYESYQGPVRSPGPKNNHGIEPPHSPKTKRAPSPPPAPMPYQTSLYGPPKPPRTISPVRCPSPKKSPAPVAPSGSPAKVSTYKLELQTPDRPQSPKFQHQVKQVVNLTPINARPSGNRAQRDEEPTAKPVTERLATWKKTVDTPQKPKADDPTDLPLSERFAGWEQRVSQTPTVDKVTSSKVQPTPKQICTTPGPAQKTERMEAMETECDPTNKSVSDRLSQWKQQDVTANPPREKEPTAYPVSDRMSAWEHISSSNKVSYIKKVDPGSSPKLSPTRPPPPVAAKTAGTPSKPTGFKPSGTPNKGLTPQKSFKESIEERAAQMGRRQPPSGEGLPPKPPSNSHSPSRFGNTPAKSQPTSSPKRMDQSSPNRPHSSPVKMGSATKTLQQRLIEQTQHSKTDQFAEKLRRERMAEVNALQNRYKNGILKEDLQLSESEATSMDEVAPPPPPPPPPPATKVSSPDKKEAIRAKARADFNKKLAAMGFEISDGGGNYHFQNQNQPTNLEKNVKSTIEISGTSSGEDEQLGKHVTSASKQPSSIYRLVSKKAPEAEKPVILKHTSSTSLKKVTFRDPNTSTETELSTGETGTETEDETYDEMDHEPHPDEIQSETQESFDDSYDSTDDSSIPDSYRGSREKQDIIAQHPKRSVSDDDVSMSAFVPASVRRESILPNQPYNDTCSVTSEDSFDYDSRTDGRHNGQQVAGLGNAQSSGESDYQPRMGRNTRYQSNHYGDQSTDESDEEGHTGEIDDLLDEAMDEVQEVEMRPKKEPVAAPRKRTSHMYATTHGELPIHDRCKSDGLAYSVSMYRTNRLSEHESASKQKIIRNSHYTQQQVYEEDIQMPTQLPPEVQRSTIKERIQELQELLSQEQSVIMQTSNALNQCCMGDSRFAGSLEQVECNRLLLVACQKRQAYLTEIQRLKESGQLDPPGQEGPKGSLTINDIRLPLKKEFVTKIGTASDNIVHYFIILIRNGPHVIFTQMLSTHDKNMRGSLDFPNLIKIHGISGKFSLVLEIYSMSVSRESHGKDKKRKTPKKPLKGFAVPVESPGGPNAVRTTSFTLITTLQITMKSLDKNCFNLERIPFLSPLHGMIYMRLKCMMEQNVEERGFLTMFEDVSGLGAWHRRWCVLAGNKLCYWKYPDDETRKDPMGFMDLKRCITEKVGLIPRDICARPNTFEVVIVRPPRKGEQDTLVTKTYSTMTTTRYQLSADTKEERIVWCNKVNRALANIRTWHADAMRPVKPK